MANKVEFSLQSKEEWIEIFPYGVTIGLDQARPVLVFKDKTERHVLPVWLNPLDAGIAMAVHGGASNLESPHNFSHELFKQNKLKIEKCLFKSVKGHHQFVEIFYKKPRVNTSPIEVRADYSMSLCLQEKVQFFSTIKHMDRCRQLDVELGQFNITKSPYGRAPIIDRPGYLN